MRDTTQSNAAVQTATEPEVERLAREVAELRAEHRKESEALRAARVADRAELDAVRAEVMGQHGSPEPDVALGQREELSKHRFARRRHNGSGEHSEPSGLVSRRRLFGLLGGAAAAGAGLAVAGSALGADPAGATVVTAGAANGDALQIGGSNTCTSETDLLSTTSSVAFNAEATGANGVAVRGEADNGTLGTGVLGLAASGYGLRGGGGRAPLLLDSNGSAGAPTTGTHNRGEFVVDSNGTLFTCVVTGTPGTWLRQSPLVTLPPARVYDSRVGQLPVTGPKSQITNGNTVSVDVTGTQAAGGSSGVPVGAKSVLGNITVVNGPNPTFLTVFAEGATPPATSNVNAGGGVVVANSFTSQLGTSNGISIKCGGGPTDFIIDIFGYYP